MKQNMTAGPPARLIFFFTLPLLAGNLFQQLYNMVDSVVVGRFVGPTALAAVGSAFPVVFLLSSLFLGLGQGAMVLVSQFYGASDEKRLKAAVDTIYTALIVGGIPLSVLGCLCVGPITGMMAIAPDALAEFRIYLLIMLGGLVGSLGYNANSGILQGLGDSKTPVLFLVVACGINIALDLLFVVVFHWGVAGWRLPPSLRRRARGCSVFCSSTAATLLCTSARSVFGLTKPFSHRSSASGCPLASSRRCSALAPCCWCGL